MKKLFRALIEFATSHGNIIDASLFRSGNSNVTFEWEGEKICVMLTKVEEVDGNSND